MNFEGYIEIDKGLYYCEKDGTPWSNRKERNNKNKYLDYLHSILGKSKGGYSYFRYKGKMIYWHRVVYEFFRGKIPKNKVIDHIDNNPLNNKIENLQLLSNKENSKKRKKCIKNTTGYAGVNWNKQNKNYNAHITINRKMKHLGAFDNPTDAYKVYLETKKKYHGEHSVDPLNTHLPN